MTIRVLYFTGSTRNSRINQGNRLGFRPRSNCLMASLRSIQTLEIDFAPEHRMDIKRVRLSIVKCFSGTKYTPPVSNRLIVDAGESRAYRIALSADRISLDGRLFSRSARCDPIGASSNGRTADSESVSLGSNPSAPAKLKTPVKTYSY